MTRTTRLATAALPLVLVAATWLARTPCRSPRSGRSTPRRFTFDATAPFTIAIEARDFKETDSGIEYIGQPNQQMGDGGLIAQVTDTTTGEVVAVTDADWSVLVVQRAPLNPECVDDPDPDSTCESEAIDLPDGWADPGFDDTARDSATVWDEAAVDPKDGYFDIAWDDDARFVWGADLEVGAIGNQLNTARRMIASDTSPRMVSTNVAMGVSLLARPRSATVTRCPQCPKAS